jgi:DNA-binding IclR family transcriptional regulator
VSSSETKSPYKVQVLDRAFAILDALATAKGDASLIELAQLVKLHKSTVHRLVMILESYRMIERDPQTGRYHLGLRLFELGTIAIASFNVRDRARPYLERVVFEVDETVHLCVLDAGEVLYVDKIEPSRSVRMASRIGRRNPAHCTAVGKAMLAHLPEREVDDILRRHGLTRLTANTITTPAELHSELKAIAARGYSVDNEEVEEGVRCTGVAVLDYAGRPIAAISVSAPAFRLPMEKVPVVAASVVRAAHALSAELGYREKTEIESHIMTQGN